MNEDTIIGDDNYQDYMEAPTGFSKGMMERTAPFGSLPFAAASTMPKIPRSEWSDRIKRMESEQSRLSDLVRGVGMKSLDQNGTNFCWANGPVNCVRIIRCVNNLPFVDLSPASVACPINGFVNQGGWGTEALKYIVEHGIVPVPGQKDWQTAVTRVVQHLNADAYLKRPRLFVAAHCRNFIKEMLGYRWKKMRGITQRNAPDQPIDFNDHMVDGLCYLIASRPQGGEIVNQRKVDPLAIIREKRKAWNPLADEQHAGSWMSV